MLKYYKCDKKIKANCVRPQQKEQNALKILIWFIRRQARKI